MYYITIEDVSASCNKITFIAIINMLYYKLRTITNVLLCVDKESLLAHNIVRGNSTCQNYYCVYITRKSKNETKDKPSWNYASDMLMILVY